MSLEFHKKLLNGYKLESHWKRLKEILKKVDSPLPGIQFKLCNGLFYFIGGKTDHLCIPKSMHKEVFKLAHND